MTEHNGSGAVIEEQTELLLDAPSPAEATEVVPLRLDAHSSDEVLFATYQQGAASGEGTIAAVRGEQAFALLYARYEPRLKGFLLRRIGDEAQAEDLTQNIFMRICRAHDKFDSTRNFSTWAFTICNNVLKNHYRTVSRNRLHNFSDMTPGISPKGRKEIDPVYDTPSSDTTPEEFAYNAEIREAIKSGVAQLKSDVRDPFTHYQVDGMNYHEISATLGIPIGTVKSRTHKARTSLREKLATFSDK